MSMHRDQALREIFGLSGATSPAQPKNLLLSSGLSLLLRSTVGARHIVAASAESEHGDRKGSPLPYTLRPPRHRSRSGYGSAPAMQNNDAHPGTVTGDLLRSSRWGSLLRRVFYRKQRGLTICATCKHQHLLVDRIAIWPKRNPSTDPYKPVRTGDVCQRLL